MTRAFVLGAGLGTRLRPLTNQLPKPLIPVHQRPLIEYAFAHLHGEGVKEFIVNTHHLPEKYACAFPDRTWQGCPVTFRHEPILLETGGGLANVQDLVAGEEPFFVYNGDVFTGLPLAPAMAQHRADGNLVTLVLRSRGPVRNVAMNVHDRRVLDVRNALGTNHPDQFQFTGLYIVEPAFFKYLPSAGAIESVVTAWLRAITAGERMGGIIIDEGLWLDLGDRDSYLEAHRLISCDARVHPSARIAGAAQIDEFSSIGANCEIGERAVIRNSVLWPGTRVLAGAGLERCIVLSDHPVSGSHEGVDL